MTEITELRAYLKEVIGLGRNAEGTARANAIIGQGIEKISDFADLAEDDDGVNKICNNVRKPSGTVDQPGWVPPPFNPQNLTAPQVPKPGHEIPYLCEHRLKLAAYGAKLYAFVGRDTITADMLTKMRLREFRNHQNVVDNHIDPDSLPEISKTFTLAKFLDQFPTYLRDLMGVDKVALSYIVRDNDVPPSSLPPLLTSKPYGAPHTSLMDELVAYAPLSGTSFEADNARVYTLLVKHLAGSAALVSTTRWQSRRNGREAFKDLVLHHLSTANWEKIIEKGERMLSDRKWNGRNSRYPLKSHINRHREAFNELVKASKKVQYNPPNETSRVRYLLTSIDSPDPALVSCKTNIRGCSVKNHDFEKAADFILINCPETKSDGNFRQNISGVKSEPKYFNKKQNSKTGKVNIGPKTGVEIRYYKRDEWLKLPKEQQEECIDIRRKRVSHDKGKMERSSRKRVSALETQLSEVSEHLISVMKTIQKHESQPSGDGVPVKLEGDYDPLKPPTYTQRNKKARK